MNSVRMPRTAATVCLCAGGAIGMAASGGADANIFQRVQGLESGEIYYGVWPTNDGGSYSVGFREKEENSRDVDILLTRHKDDGTIDWQVTYGGEGRDIGYSVQETEDGGAIVAAESDSFDSAAQVLLLRFDAGGSLQWAHAYQGTQESDRVHLLPPGVALDQDREGQIYVVGAFQGDPFLLKTDDAGLPIFQFVYEDANCGRDSDQDGIPDPCLFFNFTDVQADVDQDGRESVVVSGTVLSEPRNGDPQGPGGPVNLDPVFDGMLIRTTETGSPIWARSYDFFDDFDTPNVPNSAEWGHGLDIDREGRIVLGGISNFGVFSPQPVDGGPFAPFPPSQGTFTIVTAPNGRPVWSQRYAASRFVADVPPPALTMAFAAIEFNDFDPNRLVYAGTIFELQEAFLAGPQFLLQEIQLGIGPNWVFRYGVEGQSSGQSVKETPECGYLAGGVYIDPPLDGGLGNGNGDGYLLKTDDFGVTGCNERGLQVIPFEESRSAVFEVRERQLGEFLELEDLTEFADAIDIELCFTRDCGEGEPECCNIADLNCDGENTLDDVLLFTGLFDPAMPSAGADLNNDGLNTLDDVLIFTGAFDPDGC